MTLVRIRLYLLAMPHQRRSEYPGAIYHAMNRGDRREPVIGTHVANRLSTVTPQPSNQIELTLC